MGQPCWPLHSQAFQARCSGRCDPNNDSTRDAHLEFSHPSATFKSLGQQAGETKGPADCNSSCFISTHLSCEVQGYLGHHCDCQSPPFTLLAAPAVSRSIARHGVQPNPTSLVPLLHWDLQPGFREQPCSHSALLPALPSWAGRRGHQAPHAEIKTRHRIFK